MQAQRDPLTGVFNRGVLTPALEQAMRAEQTDRTAEPSMQTSFIMVDLDDFKVLNDRYGHAVGDQALVATAMLLQQHVGSLGKVFRFGGDEFCALITQPANTTCHKRMEAFLQALRQVQLPSSGRRTPTLSASIGVAPWSAQFKEPQDWINSADLALYQAKRQGRNCVM